jgi:preprotein translocase subunit YajC
VQPPVVPRSLPFRAAISVSADFRRVSSFLIRVSAKRAKEHAKTEARQKNDEAVTAGGLMGKVTRAVEDCVEV